MKNQQTLDRIAGINGAGMVCESRRIDLFRLYDNEENPKYDGGIVVSKAKNMATPSEKDVPLGFSGTYTFILDYPLDGEVEFDHKLSPKMTALDICKLAAADYSVIYRSPGKYGVYGHSITDLAFEYLNINDTKRRVTFDVGS